MSDKVTAYKVFIASPGGLEAEREAFRSTLAKYSEADSLHRGCMYQPIGWEITLPGVGRPQDLINDDVRECDFLVLVFWDKWGSPTGGSRKSKYTSGAEEEFYVAMECLDDPSMPMRQVVVLFKSVEERMLSNPGNQLKKVLKFRKKLEVDKTVLFSQFDEISRFEEILRSQLAQWVRDHERGGAIAKDVEPSVMPPPALLLPPEPTIEPPEFRVSEPEVNAVLERALKLEQDGQVTEAEEEFAKALAGRESSWVLYKYGGLLSRAGRFSDADRVLRRGLEATREDDPRRRALLLNELSLVADLRGEYQEGLLLDREALALEPGHPTLTMNLGIALGRVGDFKAARSLLEESLSQATKTFGEGSSQAAKAKYQLGAAAFSEGRYAEAGELMEAALETLKDYPSPPVWNKANALTVAGNLQLAMGESEQAERYYNEAAEALGEDPGDFMEIQIKRGRAELAFHRGDASVAEVGFSDALQTAESSFGPENHLVADSLVDLGRVYASQERYEEAERTFVKAWHMRSADLGSDHYKTVRAQLQLARLYAQQGQDHAALGYYERALPVLQRSLPDHPETAKAQSELDALKKLIGESPAKRKVSRKRAPTAKKSTKGAGSKPRAKGTTRKTATRKKK